MAMDETLRRRLRDYLVQVRLHGIMRVMHGSYAEVYLSWLHEEGAIGVRTEANGDLTYYALDGDGISMPDDLDAMEAAG